MKPEVKLTILIYYLLVAGGLAAVFCFIFFNHRPTTLELCFLDVGQGDAVLIRTPGNNNILIDGGPDNAVLYRLGRHLPFYERQLDLLILTHNHTDHLVGLVEILKRYRVNRILLPAGPCLTAECRAWQETIREKNISWQVADHPGRLALDATVFFDIYWPQENITEKNYNNYSIAGRLVFDQTAVILMGDLEKEEELVKSGVNLRADLIKIGHHGSNNANSPEFLAAVSARQAVISVGRDNQYKLPQARTLEILDRLGTKYYRTDRQGEVCFTGNGRSLEL
jgi:competence protein ComEC